MNSTAQIKRENRVFFLEPNNPDTASTLELLLNEGWYYTKSPVVLLDKIVFLLERLTPEAQKLLEEEQERRLEEMKKMRDEFESLNDLEQKPEGA